MNRPELYTKTVNILYQAYFNDTLEHGNCYACAVGNIIAANKGLELARDNGEGMFGQMLYWKNWTPYRLADHSEEVRFPAWFSIIWPSARITNPERIEEEILSTGYNSSEIIKIEKAFESAESGEVFQDRMFNGLVAVLDVLRQIHEVTDEDLITTNTKRFAEHYKTKAHAQL